MSRSGFSLPETVVALSLFALASVTLCQAALNARHALLRLDERQAAYLRIDWVRDDILAITDRAVLEEGGEIVFPQEIRKTPGGDGGRDGDQEPVRARWEAEIRPTYLLDVHRLDITLTLEHGEEMIEPQMASYYVYRPHWYAEAEERSRLETDKQEAWEKRQMEREW